MVSLGIIALAFFVFMCCWVAQHGLPVLGMKLDESDLLLISEKSGEDVLEA
jgi:flagellar biosynthesis/type III secretory pathway M-ring protein FliF/YscJ